jgi:large subunit ribosomal protein L25
MAEILDVVPRKADGKRVARRLRTAGSVPAILYGHKEACVALAIKSEQLSSVVRHGTRVVELRGAANEKAFIRDLQWDVYGVGILHVDLTRVSEHERIQVEIKVELRGEAPGIKNGGVLEHLLHEVEIDCEALSIPEKLFVSVNELNVGNSLLASSVVLPAGAKLLTDPDAVVVQCVVPVEVDETAGAEAGAEPEVIGRKADDEAEAD